jgi:hypothetical protein
MKPKSGSKPFHFIADVADESFGKSSDETQDRIPPEKNGRTEKR